MHKSVPLIPVLSDAAPRPAGHYSQAMIAGQQVFISGQLPIRPDSASLPDDGFESQAEQAIAERLVRVTAYIVGVENWPRFNAVYAAMLPNARPARTVVPVPELHHGYLVEVDAIAFLADD